MGRPKGVPNKVTSDVRERFKLLLESVGVEKMKKWLGQIEDPARRLEVLGRLAEYVVPKLGRTEVSGEGGGPIVVEIVKERG